MNVEHNITCRYCCAARIALVKCRDLHWAMMAHRDQRDTSLASLRMLIVSDGANPCEYFVTLQLWEPRFFQITQMRCNVLNSLSLAVKGRFLPVMPS